ncbi:evolutionarily conserved signaling intermediate in Toll pathway, mitochondrial isoform X4 [Numida meleagris]|uniref:evolutionarily conserved signaling intermediate in Toll pathway, mitochondrial isoform X4 n=1 Tax=Numida meleagris TaxID=8996 RepID=UPI000B3DADBE|nr:evolutionarily conserved signaling intermediate in Toll pathway, mitochondrial isoform X4 [Numida meleagris]
MRLSWARALPLRLWGGCGAPKAARPMCHRSSDAPEPPSDHGPQTTPRDEERGGPAAFAAALAELERTPGRRLGRLELVAAALAAMPALGVARQRDAYNRLLRLLPRGPWVPRGPFHRLFAPFPRQQECGLQILEQMERYGVVPDAETRFLLLAIFGPRSRPVRKCQRMLYWLPRMRHANPYPLPAQLPPPGLAAACLGLRRIANDPDARLSVYQASRVQNSRSCWPGTAQSILSLWRDRSHCGCAALACSTMCCGETLSPPICENLPPTLSAACTIPCTLTWTWSVAHGMMMSSMWMRGLVTSAPWPSGSRVFSRPTLSLARRQCSSAWGMGIPLLVPLETGMHCTWRNRGQPSWSPPRWRGAARHRERDEGA